MTQSQRFPRTLRALSLFSLFALLAFLTSPAAASGPGRLRFEDPTLEVSEGQGVLTVVVERDSGEDGAITVEVATASGSAVEGEDFAGVSSTLSWGDGDRDDRSLAISIVDDDIAEGTETLTVVLRNPTGGATLDDGKNVAVVSIFDNDSSNGGDDPGDDDGEDDHGNDDGNDDNGNDDGNDDNGNDDGNDDNGGDDGQNDDDGSRAGVLKFDQRTFLTREGSPMAIVTVERSHGESGAVSVEFSTSDGTATDGMDYTATAATLEWTSGDGSTKSVLVPILDDTEGERDETVELMLSGATGGAVIDSVRGTAVLTILDNDGGGGAAPGDDNQNDDRPGVLKFDERSFEVIEGQTMAVIVVERSMGERGAVTVDYSTSDGSAEEGLDYESVSGTLSWGPGDGSNRTFLVPILSDDTQEGTETVQLELSDPTGGAVLDAERGQSILRILDDDNASSACTPSSSTLCLQNRRFSAELTWRAFDGSTGRGQVVPISDTSGLFWFFREDNIEVLLKTVDACSLTGAEGFWVFYAATTNVDFTLTVTDTVSGVRQEYTNLLGAAAEPIQDVGTFRVCP